MGMHKSIATTEGEFRSSNPVAVEPPMRTMTCYLTRNFHFGSPYRIIVHPNRLRLCGFVKSFHPASRRWPRNGPDLPPAGTKRTEGAAVQAIFQTPRRPTLLPSTGFLPRRPVLSGRQGHRPDPPQNRPEPPPRQLTFR